MSEPQSAEAVRAGDARACGRCIQCGRTGTASRELWGDSTLYSWSYDGAERYVCRGPCRDEEVSNGDDLYLGPCPPDAEWTDEQFEQLRAECLRKMRQRGEIRLLTPLPRRVRLRVAATRAIDSVAIWLAGHGRFGAAERLWRTFGMWRR